MFNTHGSRTNGWLFFWLGIAVPREGSRPLGALSGDGEGHLVRAHVRKERLTKNKHQLAEEAAKVLTQVDRIDCLSSENGKPITKITPKYIHRTTLYKSINLIY